MKLQEKQKAISLRIAGYSLTEIAQRVKVSKSTVSNWVRDISLSLEAQCRLSEIVSAGQLKSAELKKKRKATQLEDYYSKAKRFLISSPLGRNFSKIACSLIYWCEGGKYEDCMIQFTNSDPNLIAGFLSLLRQSYILDESKFRACLHLHEYHDQNTQIGYWSQVSQIPPKQFIKPYLKKHTAKRIRKNYQGCFQIRYYDAHIARQVLLLGKAFFDKYRGLV